MINPRAAALYRNTIGSENGEMISDWDVLDGLYLYLLFIVTFNRVVIRL